MSLETEQAIAEMTRSFLGDRDTIRASYDELVVLVREAYEAGEFQGAKDTRPAAF